MNGRAFGDKEGKFACKTVSVIDFVITSKKALPLFKDFEVGEFCPLISDIHCPLIFKLRSCDEPIIEQPRASKSKIKRWRADKAAQIVNNIDVSKLKQVMETFESDNIDKDTLSDMVKTIENLMVDSAKETFGTYIPNVNLSSKDNRNNKQWFDKNCKGARLQYHMTRRRYNRAKNNADKEEMLESCKAYKRFMRESFTQNKRKVRKKIRSMRSSSPR